MRDYPNAANIIRREMYRCGYVLERLSEKTEISPAVLRGILTGRSTTISTRNMVALARAFDYSASEFIDILSQE